jgi:hypothetical protein
MSNPPHPIKYVGIITTTIIRAVHRTQWENLPFSWFAIIPTTYPALIEYPIAASDRLFITQVRSPVLRGYIIAHLFSSNSPHLLRQLHSTRRMPQAILYAVKNALRKESHRTGAAVRFLSSCTLTDCNRIGSNWSQLNQQFFFSLRHTLRPSADTTSRPASLKGIRVASWQLRRTALTTKFLPKA